MHTDRIDVDLWRPLIEAKPKWKRGSQGIGDCVSWGAELCATILLAIQAKNGQSEWIEEAATEPIYGGARVEANGGKLGGYQDGSWGSAAAKWLQDSGGVVLRQDYSAATDVDEHDLRAYDKNRAKEWGNFGCGGVSDAGRADGLLDKIAKEHPCKTVTSVKTTEELASALQNGYPVSVASMVGFGRMQRNKNGVCLASGQWAHQMAFAGIRWVKNEPQFRQFQSWGKSCSGPDPGTECEAVSDCSWWTTSEDAGRQLRANDSFAFSSVEGFPPQKITWSEVANTWDWSSVDP